MNGQNGKKRLLSRRALLPLFVWSLINIASVLCLSIYQHTTSLSQLQAASFTLHRQASQRADQHDAHLTALSTIAQSKARSEETSQLDVFEEVAGTIIRFYPRIDEIQLVPVNPEGRLIGSRPLEPELITAVRQAALSSGKVPHLMSSDKRPGHYLIVKRSPNTESPHDGLMLSINADALISSDDPFWDRPGTARRILMPDGTVLASHPGPFDSGQFSKKLGSSTQPLIFETAIAIGWSDLLPPNRLVPILVLVNLLFFGGLVIARQTQRTRQAERQAELSGLEARLAHATRVNSLGEMASGMAHELTQPLTALLASAQASRRLLERNNFAAVAEALDDIVQQARRASAILDRLRNWSRPQRQGKKPSDLRNSLMTVKTLLDPEARRRSVSLDLIMPLTPVIATVDAVEMEQVMFNLLRNAIEAFTDNAPQNDRRVEASLKLENNLAVLEIADNGPGVDSQLLDRLFTPFATGRSEGTGLGLALSKRLVEGFGGEIHYIPNSRGALFRVELPNTQGEG